MTGLIDAALDRSRMVLLALALILIAGTVAYIQIPKEAQPEVKIPIIYVSMSLEGISPSDAERLLVRPMEKELRAIEGIKEMRSTASEGHASVLLEFDAGFDADQALLDVRERVDVAQSDLPAETDEPSVTEINTSAFPVMVVTLSGGVPERTLFRLARVLKDAIETLPTILEANIVGDREEVLDVIVDPLLLESYNISNQELVQAINLNNRLVAAGALDTGQGRFSVKVPGLFETAADVLDLPIKVNGYGVVTLADITTIRRTFKDATTFARLNGEPAVALEIVKRAGTNIIENNYSVRAVVDAVSADWPAGINTTYSQDQSEFTITILGDLQNNVLSAIVLVMIIIVAALGLRGALLVGVAIPGSFLIGILMLAILGMTMNMVVMFSLNLAVGMLVDGAIVVTEFADRRMREGMHRRQAYAAAAKRMAWPITASTATTLAAFMPLLFWPGIVGEFMVFLPITLIGTLTGSLLMALIFVPALGSYFGRPGNTNPRAVARQVAAETGDLSSVDGFMGAYIRLLTFLVRRPLAVVFAAVLMLAGVWGYYLFAGNGVTFFADVDPDNARVLVHARGNMSIEERDVLVREVEERILAVRGIETAYARTSSGGAGNTDAADVIGSIYIEFLDWDKRRPAKEILTEIRASTADLAGIRVEVREPEEGPPTGKAIQVHLSGRDPAALNIALEKIRAAMEGVEGLVDLEDSRPIPGIEWRLTVDRAQAGRFGADITSVGNVVKLVTNGINVGEYRPDDADEEVDIRVRFPLGDRNIAELDDLRVLTANGQVPISNFVTRTAEAKTGTLERIDGLRTLRIEAEVLPGILPDTKVREVRGLIGELDIDASVFVTFKGEDEEQQAATEFLSKAFVVALFIMTIILVTQFNSFYRAFLILSSVILSTVGVMIGLLVMNQPFSIVMTGVGIITLAGVVVNNNIVLIDTYAILRKSGMEAVEAIIRTGAQRMRPVLLTAITTVAGLMPMVTGVGIDFVTREITVGAPSTQWWVGLATAVAFGLTFATILTLIVTPCMLALGQRTSDGMTVLRARLGGGRGIAPEAAE